MSPGSTFKAQSNPNGGKGQTHSLVVSQIQLPVPHLMETRHYLGRPYTSGGNSKWRYPTLVTVQAGELGRTDRQTDTQTDGRTDAAIT